MATSEYSLLANLKLLAVGKGAWKLFVDGRFHEDPDADTLFEKPRVNYYAMRDPKTSLPPIAAHPMVGERGYVASCKKVLTLPVFADLITNQFSAEEIVGRMIVLHDELVSDVTILEPIPPNLKIVASKHSLGLMTGTEKILHSFELYTANSNFVGCCYTTDVAMAMSHAPTARDLFSAQEKMPHEITLTAQGAKCFFMDMMEVPEEERKFYPFILSVRETNATPGRCGPPRQVKSYEEFKKLDANLERYSFSCAQKISGANIRECLVFHVNKYNQEIALAKDDNIKKLRAICRLLGNIERIHPFFDGNCRTSYFLMQILLLKNHLPPSILENPNQLDGLSVLELVVKVIAGMEKFARCFPDFVLPPNTFSIATLKEAYRLKQDTIAKGKQNKEGKGKEGGEAGPAVNAKAEGAAKVNVADHSQAVPVSPQSEAMAAVGAFAHQRNGDHKAGTSVTEVCPAGRGPAPSST